MKQKFKRNGCQTKMNLKVINFPSKICFLRYLKFYLYFIHNLVIFYRLANKDVSVKKISTSFDPLPLMKTMLWKFANVIVKP